MNHLDEFMTGKRIKGFTLIELLMVMAVLSVLATVLVTLINPAEMLRKSKDSKRISDLGTLKRSIDLALADDQVLTSTGGALNIDNTTSTTNFSGLDLSKYISVIPQDPAYVAGGGNMQIIAVGCTKGTTTKGGIAYQFWSDGDTYMIKANMESLSNCPTVEGDGNNNSTYELGNDPGLDAI